MLSTEMMQNALGLRLWFSIALQSAVRSCKNLLCVSADATAPNFRTVTIVRCREVYTGADPGMCLVQYLFTKAYLCFY